MAKRARRTWLLVVIGIVALIVVGGLMALRPNVKPLTWAIRASAVLGYLCVFVAALSSIYMRELVRWFGRPFAKTLLKTGQSGLEHPVYQALLRFASIVSGVYLLHVSFPRPDKSWAI